MQVNTGRPRVTGAFDANTRVPRVARSLKGTCSPVTHWCQSSEHWSSPRHWTQHRATRVPRVARALKGNTRASEVNTGRPRVTGSFKGNTGRQ